MESIAVACRTAAAKIPIRGLIRGLIRGRLAA
jgi:hypothetical protein